MRILLDENVPQVLRHHIPGHAVSSARFAKLDGLLNGDLLDAMTGAFDVLVTCDRSLSHQQSVKGRPVVIVVLRAPSNRPRDLIPLMVELVRTLVTVQPGKVYDVGPI